MVYLPREKTVIVTQHVRNVDTLIKDQNAQLRRGNPTVEDGEIGERGGYDSMNTQYRFQEKNARDEDKENPGRAMLT